MNRGLIDSFRPVLGVLNLWVFLPTLVCVYFTLAFLGRATRKKNPTEMVRFDCMIESDNLKVLYVAHMCSKFSRASILF